MYLFNISGIDIPAFLSLAQTGWTLACLNTPHYYSPWDHHCGVLSDRGL